MAATTTTTNGVHRPTAAVPPSRDPSSLLRRAPPKSRRGRGSGDVRRLLLTALVAGTACYRLGKFAGCASPWLSGGMADGEGEGEDASYLAPVDAATDYGYEDDGGEEEADDPDASEDPTATDYDEDGEEEEWEEEEEEEEADSDAPESEGPAIGIRRGRPAAASDATDRRTMPRPSLPYSCGVVFFYHIPSTGGRSINMWLRKYRKYDYYQYWKLSVGKDGKFHPDPEGCEAKFAAGVTERIQDLGPDEWRIVHSHVTSTYLNESEGILREWRSAVEAQGCQMINTIMLRDPLNHAMSLHKIVKSKNSTQDVWADYLESPTGTGRWGTVLDFFLYNIHGNRYHEDYPHGPGGRNPFNVTREEKVARAMELLHRHFDVVSVADHAAFVNRVLELTGWEEIPMPRTNVHKGTLRFTKKEVERLQKLLQKNGDFDFVDRVKYEYHDYLSYLDR